MEGSQNINTDFSEILKGLDNQWAILSSDSSEVIVSAENLEELADRLSEGILIKVPNSDSYLAPVQL